MIIKEVADLDKFARLNIYSDSTVLLDVKEKYPKEYKTVINDLNSFTKDNVETYESNLDDYSEEELIEIHGEDTLLEWIDELFDEEILINYIVKEQTPTDRGLWETIVCSGYALI